MEGARRMLAELDVEEWLRDLAVGGVNHSIPGNGGDECRDFIPYWQRLAEFLLLVPSSALGLWQLLPALSLAFSQPPREVSRYWVLTLYSLVFGAELAFKMISRTGIFLLNPCHLATMMQLALLSMDPKQPLTCFLFRLHLSFVPGAIFALTFPILNTRLLPGEVFIYYVQHLLILFVPAYLMYIRGAFEAEPLSEWAWPAFGLLLLFVYHFGPLQFLAMQSNVNLNNILCPAISDPFGTRFYHVFAVLHQGLLVPLFSKCHSFLCSIAAELYHEVFHGSADPRKRAFSVESDALCLGTTSDAP